MRDSIRFILIIPIAIILAVLLLIFVSGVRGDYYDSLREEAERPIGEARFTKIDDETNTITDLRTGCQYIVWESPTASGITELLDEHGNPVCLRDLKK